MFNFERVDPNNTFAPSDCIAYQFEDMNKVVYIFFNFEEADLNDTFAPSDYAGLTLTFPFFRNFFLCGIFFMLCCATVLLHPSERKLIFKRKFLKFYYCIITITWAFS